MKYKREKHAFLILSDCVSDSMLKLYFNIEAATRNLGDTYLIFHTKGNESEQLLMHLNTYTFTNTVLSDLGYTPVRDTLVPGSNHFPILKFYLDHQNYDYYWCIEDDVMFNGEWASFFNEIIKNVQYDFISSFVKRFNEKINPDWIWWNSLSHGNDKIDIDDLVMSFNPIYSLSNRSAGFLDRALKDGWVGHHEVLIATLLNKSGFLVKDFGGRRKFVPPGFNEKFYTDKTHVWRPAFTAPGKLMNKIYHPVKEKIKVTIDFKYKISFCVIIAPESFLAPKTLIESIENSLEYENCEFIVIGSLGSRALSQLKLELHQYIESGRLAIYQTHRPVFNDSYLNNVAGKLSNGDILCFLNADQIISKSFADRINRFFKFNRNLAIVISHGSGKASKNHKIHASLSLMKDDFSRLAGFNDKLIDFKISQLNFIEKLGEIGLHIFNVKELPDSPCEHLGFAPIQSYLTLTLILVHHVEPAISSVIFMYKDGYFEIGTIVNNSTEGHSSFEYSYRIRKSAFEFTRKELEWACGYWYLASDDKTLILKYVNGKENSLYVRDQYYEMPLSDGCAVWQILNEPDEKRRLINFHHQLKQLPKKTDQFQQSDERSSYIDSNPIILVKNFKPHQPVIVN